MYWFMFYKIIPFQGSLSDIKGRKNILMLTLLVCAVAYTTLGITNSVVVILIIRAVLGNNFTFLRGFFLANRALFTFQRIYRCVQADADVNKSFSARL